MICGMRDLGGESHTEIAMRSGSEVRAMEGADWDAVCSIYEQGIADGDATFETEAPSWAAWDAAHLPPCRIVARDGAEVLGWAALRPVSERNVYAGVAELSIYVARRWRRHGVGATLMSALTTLSERDGIWTLQAGIFPENQASIALCTRHGFRIVGVRERLGQMAGRWRDVVLLERRSTSVGGAPIADHVVAVDEQKSALCRRILESLPAWFGIPAAIERYVTEVEALPMYAVHEGGEPVGVLSLKEHSSAAAEIHVMGVLPSRHRKGLGTALVRAAENHARRRGLRFLTVKTLSPARENAEYARTREFYGAVGFLPLEEFPDLWGGANPCLMMAKAL